ncbi:hypothetical protein JTE90_016752 [Oedothorax gibbosus]|uniref:Integrase catalytic domain-containing protein n=1 Tax=Oedothorax gibbosus TaxID=931172 RepID=A0AAV6W0K3_9ARAC|nr:hypothetical protein JTE90_016752 [Oedothorax gibbosus]
MKPLPEKVDAVLQYKLPETIAALRKFLGLLNFYRRFVLNTAEHQCLLHSFVKGSKGKRDNRRIDWTRQAVAAFKKCKQTIAETTLLCHPAPSAPLALHVDASDFAIGGALHQIIDGELQPLAFFSRKLSPAEKHNPSNTSQHTQLQRHSSPVRFSRYGPPSTVTTDQGRQFEASLFRSLTQFLGIHRSRTTSYHPLGNGMIEVFHRSLKSAIKAMQQSAGLKYYQQSCWDYAQP